MKDHTRFIAEAAIIAALYFVLTVAMEPLCYGPLQCRISEALTILPILTPAAIPGLYTGCLLSNLMGPYGLIDVIVGPLLTLLAAAATRYFRGKTLLALSCPVIINAFGVSAYLYLLSKTPFWISVLSIGTGEALAVYGFGILLLLALRKTILCGEP